MLDKTTLEDGTIIIPPKEEVVLDTGAYDELEYDCWNLICTYLKLHGFTFKDSGKHDADPEPHIDFELVKQVQDEILDIVDDISAGQQSDGRPYIGDIFCDEDEAEDEDE